MAKKVITAVLIATPWGHAINFEGKYAFLDYHGNFRDFTIGQEYSCEIFYRLNYGLYPDKSNRDWTHMDGASREEISESIKFKKYNIGIEKEAEKNPGFEKYRLSANNAFPKFNIKIL
ncbi:hypothetical protein K8Q96_02210 [Candidatus Nomurabacteria bacterium]|nr:hypothetical protein [Candidatus Nomurabacteria bacterium]